ncbi:carbon-nitrogen hydrolase family protein [Peribacillus asahii]|uniref:carbon-nitrogen hydrolase family protein n=1 Tax=Peribacillus asahii TaxID=228899 RepID=UPI0037FF861C
MVDVKVAVVQMDPKLGEIQVNLQKTISFVQEAGNNGANLIVFPECSLTGYCFENREDAERYALTIGDYWNQQLIDEAKKFNCYIVVGLVERDGKNLYNSALVIGPNGNKDIYRKSHLSELGVDNFIETDHKPYSVIQTEFGKLGVLICYDIRFPEQARVLSLEGADVLVHITNLPLTASSQVDILLPARANENRVYVLSSDRVGEEQGYQFLGRSIIYDIDGKVINEANDKDEMIIYANLDFKNSREKDVFYPPGPGKPGNHMNKLFKSRRPDLYSTLTKQHQNK